MLKNVAGIYLCLFSQGTLKVGRAKNVHGRLMEHRASGAVFGITVARYDAVFCNVPAKAEIFLINWCNKNSTSCQGDEWFQGVDYEACLKIAKSIAITLIGPHQPNGVGVDDKFTKLLTKAGIIKAELARRFGMDSRTISAWGNSPPQYAVTYLELLIEFNRIAP